MIFSLQNMISIPNKNPLAVLEDEKLKHIKKLGRMEWEMQEMFNKKLNQKLKKIKEFSLAESQKLEDEKQKWQQQKEEMSQSRKNFEFEKNDFNNSKTEFFNNRTTELSSSHAKSPSHSNNSTTSTQSALYKKRFTFNVFSQMKPK